VAAIRVNTNQAFCSNSGLLPPCAAGGWAYWNGASATFGSKQAAAFTYANATLNNSDLFLKVTGTFALGLYPNGIGVNYNAGTVTISTYSNLVQSVVGTLSTTLASGSTLTALADANGWVYVWNGSTFVGAVQTSVTGSTGRIGMHLANGARIDNFSGGTVAP
jgi:hypothetical protein